MTGSAIVSSRPTHPYADTTTDVVLSIGRTVIETPREAGLGWPDELADYASVSADGVKRVRVPFYRLTINRGTGIPKKTRLPTGDRKTAAV